VNGREVNMGEMDCRFDVLAHNIVCPMPTGGSMHFVMCGDSIEGKMTMPNGTL
jgi:hypothetical protein